jgi:hypothetical protein
MDSSFHKWLLLRESDFVFQALQNHLSVFSLNAVLHIQSNEHQCVPTDALMHHVLLKNNLKHDNLSMKEIKMAV